MNCYVDGMNDGIFAYGIAFLILALKLPPEPPDRKLALITGILTAIRQRLNASDPGSC
jgi:hypothetical protein